MTDDIVKDQPARGKRYVGVAVIPRRRRAIERACGRIVELGGEALLITADGSARARWPGVEHLDLLKDEMRLGPNRLLAVSPKRVAGKVIGRKVGGRSLLWRGWVKSRPYKTFRFYALWHLLQRYRDVLRPDDITDVLLAGVESWPIAWHLAQENPDLVMGWDVPDEWKRPVEDEPLGLKRVAVWGGTASWHIFTQGGDHRAESVRTFASSSWVAQAGPAANVADLVPQGEEFEERVVREDLTSTLITEIISEDPHIVLVDPLPELSDIVHIGEWATLTEFTNSLNLDGKLTERADRVLAWDDPERIALLAECAHGVATRLREDLPDATFVLHRVRLTNRTRHPHKTGARGATSDAVLARMNQVLDQATEIMSTAFGEDLKFIDVPAELRMTGKPDPKGPAQTGFATAYNEHALAALDAIARGLA